MDVVTYEQKQLTAPIREGYCLSVSLRDRQLHTWEIVKLESLGLLLKYQPAFFIQRGADTSSDNLLCLSMRYAKKRIEEDAQKIQKRYPQISHYVTGIVFLSANRRIHRAVPGIEISNKMDRQAGKYHRENLEKQAIGGDAAPGIRQRTSQHMQNDPHVQDVGIVHRHNGTTVSKTKLKDVYIITHASRMGVR